MSELDDGCDEILSESYETVIDYVEKRSLMPNNMLHTVRNTKKEIKRNHLLAKIRLQGVLYYYNINNLLQ